MATDRPGAVWTQHKPTIAVPRSLWAAAKANDVVQLARLLDEGCAIDERDYRGYSALMLAGYCGNLDAVDLLLQRGADPNTRDFFGNTVLMGAAYKGSAAVVLRLLAAGAETLVIPRMRDSDAELSPEHSDDTDELCCHPRSSS